MSFESGAEVARGLVALDGSFVMVEVDDERLKVFARGARWVSFSSARDCQSHD